MAVNSRQGLIDYCLRKLGYPTIQINVDDDQVSDRIDDSLQYFSENIFDGIEKVFLKHTVTSTDVTNGWIDAGDPIIGVTRVFPSKGLFSGSFFDQEFQLRVTDLDRFTGVSVIDYYVNQANFSLLENLLSTERSFQFNKKQNRIVINALWGTDIQEGDILVIEAYRILDPNVFTEVYDDAFLKQYATAQIKLQWGSNLSKYEGVQLPGGVTVNGEKIFNEAQETINKLEEETLSKWQIPPLDMVG